LTQPVRSYFSYLDDLRFWKKIFCLNFRLDGSAALIPISSEGCGFNMDEFNRNNWHSVVSGNTKFFRNL
jgi:hypothetical protein